MPFAYQRGPSECQQNMDPLLPILFVFGYGAILFGTALEVQESPVRILGCSGDLVSRLSSWPYWGLLWLVI